MEAKIGSMYGNVPGQVLWMVRTSWPLKVKAGHGAGRRAWSVCASGYGYDVYTCCALGAVPEMEQGRDYMLGTNRTAKDAFADPMLMMVDQKAPNLSDLALSA